MRIHLAFIVSILALWAAPRHAWAQDYRLPDEPGKSEVLRACNTCHGPMTLIHAGKRSPHQWDEILNDMARRGMVITDAQRSTILGYLNAYFGQPADFARTPVPRAPGPGMALALEAAAAAQKACEAKGRTVTTLVSDSVGMPLVVLSGAGSSRTAQAVAATQVATVLKYQATSGAVLRRLQSDPVLSAQIADDPAIGEVHPGGIPIQIEGGQILGAIAVAGSSGSSEQNEVCARAGLTRIATKLRQQSSTPKRP